MPFRDTCPKRTIVAVTHTIQTTLPVTLNCGHVEYINWTARVGSQLGCVQCQDALTDCRNGKDSERLADLAVMRARTARYHETAQWSGLRENH